MSQKPDSMTEVEKTVWGSPAGKKRLSKKLAAMIPSGYTTYVEPFAGSAAVFFALEQVDTEVLNDMDPEIAFAFKAIATLSDAEMKSLGKKSWTGNKETYKKLYTQWRSGKSLGKVDRLHRFLYLSHFSFGKLRSGSFNGNADGIVAQTPGKVDRARERLSGVKVHSEDYRKVCSKYDGTKTFFFLDPPYVGSDALNRTSREGGGTNTGEKSFNEEDFYKFLKGLKGKFLITYGVTGKTDWPGFHVSRITSPRSIASMPGVKGPKTLTHLLISNYKISKADIAKAVGDDWTIEPVVKGFPGGEASAGLHMHALDREARSTKLDGTHSHTFVSLDGKAVVTEEDGQHLHGISCYDGGATHITHDGEHIHHLKLPGGVTLRTEVGGYHGHDVHTETTGFDGTHVHKLVLPDGSIVESLDADGEWRRAGKPVLAAGTPAASSIATSKQAGLAGALRNFTLRAPFLVLSDGDLYVRTDGIKKAVEAAIADMLPADVAATVRVIEGEPPSHYVEAADLSVQVREKMVAKHAVDKAAGDAPEMPDVLTWDAVWSGRMPPDGESGLPAFLEKQVPGRFRYWKAEGDRACEVRDALMDSAPDIRMVNGQPTLVTVQMSVFSPSAGEEALAKRADFVHQVARIMKDTQQGVLWTLNEFPNAKLEDGQVLVIAADVADLWSSSGESMDSLVRKVADLKHGWILPLRDSVGARAALSRVGTTFLIRKSATMGWVFGTNVDVAKAQVEIVELPSIGDTRREFTLSRQVWKSGKQSVWHLMIDRPEEGLEAWVLQGDPVEKGCVGIQKDVAEKAMLDFQGDIDDGEIWIEDRGTVSVTDRCDGVCKLRIDGTKLRGDFVLTGRGTGSIWKLEHASRPAAAGEAGLQEVTKSYDVSKLVIAEKAKDERFVYGIVLEPETVDSQGDIYSEESVRVAAHKFMAEFQNIGIQHSELAKQVDILESFLAPTSFSEGGKDVKKGTWLLAVRVKSATLWADIKAGKFTGFSIGGTAMRRPEKS